ncbi:MAG: hypothetical protein R3200_17555, partial [Xanthomonadales bacterium]|nr:hypothetical protein [Xanthomonadales bacterium]
MFGIFLSLVLGAAQAEVKQVAPGNETLATAVTNAVAGDVLELLTGNYSGTTVTIDKQLTLRAASASDDPVLLLPLSLTADGIRLQDLNFNGTSITSSADVVIAGNALVNTAVTANNSLASLTFIDNTMEQKVFSPRGEVNFIGNTFTNVVIQGSPTTARVLGNVFNATEAERQIALGGSEVAIIGNEFAVVGRGNTLDANITCSPSADCLVIGNRISYEGQFTSPTFVPRILNANGSRVFVRNNLIKMTSATGNDAAGLNAIRIDRTGVFIDISNNIIDFGGFAIGNDPDVAENGAIHVEDSATVQGNILVGIQRPTFTFDPRAVANQFLANLCSNTL